MSPARITNPGEESIMMKIDEVQQHGKEQLDAAVAAAGSFQKGVQAIALAFSDYTRKSLEDGNAFTEKLAGVRSLDKVVEAQTEYAKKTYETFVAESQKIGELYADLAKQTFKPFEDFAAKFVPAAR
jgi:phasin family protein